MPLRWPWRQWTRQGSYFTVPTGERNDFGVCFFGRVRPVSAARIRLPRKNPGEDVCRGQSSLTFSETTGKSYARPASALVIDIAFPTWFGFAPLGCRSGTSLPFRSRGEVFRPTKEKIDGSAGGFK